MTYKRSQLVATFTEDHQHMTRGFFSLFKALEANNIRAAVDIAKEIDRKTGPHVAFEETAFYPELRKVYGDAYVDGLYAEHRDALAVITEIMNLDPQQPIPDERRMALADQARHTLEHAAACGRLLGHLEALDEQRREELLEELMAIRERGEPWSRHVSSVRA